MASIEDFKGAFTEMARPNRFRCNGFEMAGLEFLAKSSAIPATTIGAMELPWMGRQVKMAGDRTFGDFTMTIYNDDSMTLRKKFEEWVEQLNGVESNVGETAKRDGFIHQLGRNDEVLATFNIRGAIPTDVGTIDMDWSSNDTPSEFSVTLAYDYHVMS